MCGIVGYVGDRQAWPIVVEGLRRLEYRGYDSAGVAVIEPEGGLHLRKTVGRVVGLLHDSTCPEPEGSAALGHTRWATHGRPTEANSHPHTDCSGRIAVAHNGIVENYLALKTELQRRGHEFKSETDTEVIPHLIEEGMNDGLSLPKAVLRMGSVVQGPQAIVAVREGDDDSICAMRLGHAGGVAVAHHAGQGIVSSDLPALLPIIGERGYLPVGFLDDGEAAVVARSGITFLDRRGEPVHKQMRPISLNDVLVDRAGYRHYMLKEIMEQPQAVVSAMRDRVNFTGGRVTLPELSMSNAELAKIHRVVLIGCGTSLNAAQVGRHLVERLAGVPAEAESASEFRYREPMLDDSTLVVAIGQSGETADTVAAMEEVRRSRAKLVTICNSPDSQATRLADSSLLMRSGIEVGVASSKTFIASLTILNLLAMRLAAARNRVGQSQMQEWVDNLARIPGHVANLVSKPAEIDELAGGYSNRRNFIYLGRGINAPIATEGALKLKEISYIHAEAYPAGEMKHGPIALIDHRMPTMAIAPDDALYDKMVNNVQEVKARGGAVLGVLTDGDARLSGLVDGAMFIPRVPDHLTPIVATVPLQLFAYHIAVRRGCDVDQPRNLAKSVTVE
ncbi:MAG: glutamine--fructose-6-phosphate transaminase (isomerizing) [Chloroflexi bacterium]|nr:glutamine--fructose-6-phosphate transaminase (isomerizing) [Chloroflexota bacterium]